MLIQTFMGPAQIKRIYEKGDLEVNFPDWDDPKAIYSVDPKRAWLDHEKPDRFGFDGERLPDDAAYLGPPTKCVLLDGSFRTVVPSEAEAMLAAASRTPEEVEALQAKVQRRRALDVIERKAAQVKQSRHSRFTQAEVDDLVGNAKAYEVDGDLPKMYHQTLSHKLRGFIRAGEMAELLGLLAHPNADPEDRKPDVCFGAPIRQDQVPDGVLVLDVMWVYKAKGDLNDCFLKVKGRLTLRGDLNFFTSLTWTPPPRRCFCFLERPYIGVGGLFLYVRIVQHRSVDSWSV